MAAEGEALREHGLEALPLDAEARVTVQIGPVGYWVIDLRGDLPVGSADPVWTSSDLEIAQIAEKLDHAEDRAARADCVLRAAQREAPPGASLGLTVAISKAACGAEEHGSGTAVDAGAGAVCVWARGAASVAARSRRILRKRSGHTSSLKIQRFNFETCRVWNCSTLFLTGLPNYRPNRTAFELPVMSRLLSKFGRPSN